MNEFETINIYKIAPYGVYYKVEENGLLTEFEEKLQECDYIIVEKRQAKAMFDQRSKFEAFARQYGFVTHWDERKYVFVCAKEPPWIE